MLKLPGRCSIWPHLTPPYAPSASPCLPDHPLSTRWNKVSSTMISASLRPIVREEIEKIFAHHPTPSEYACGLLCLRPTASSCLLHPHPVIENPLRFSSASPLLSLPASRFHREDASATLRAPGRSNRPRAATGTWYVCILAMWREEVPHISYCSGRIDLFSAPQI
jgi:hypothetical protein